MIVRIITVRVKKGSEEAFEAATRLNHEGSVKEAGVLRFDVLRDNDSPGTYYLYEAYRDEQATLDHKQTAHYHLWRDEVADLMEGDRAAVACSVVAPDTDGW
jgi:autoinducer 2-degrading protein